MKLGNLIELITTYTGIKYLVDTYHSLRGTKCNCDKRKDALLIASGAILSYVFHNLYSKLTVELRTESLILIFHLSSSGGVSVYSKTSNQG